MTEKTGIMTEYSQAKEFERKCERNGIIGYFLQAVNKNWEVCCFSFFGMFIVCTLWFKGALQDPSISGWIRLLLFRNNLGFSNLCRMGGCEGVELYL